MTWARLRAEVTYLWWHWMCSGFCCGCDRPLWRWRDRRHHWLHVDGCSARPLRSD